MLCPPPYGMRADLLVKKLLAENYIGRPQHVRLQSLTSAYLDPDAPAHWRQKIEISGLNALTLGIYVEVLQRWLGDIGGVFARGKILMPIRQGYEVIIPDLLTVLCVFQNGAEGVLEFSGVNAHAPGDRLDIYGDKGTLVYDFATDIVQVGKVGDKDLRVIDLTPDLLTEWRFHRGGEIEGADSSGSRFRRWRALHARRPGGGRFPRAQRMGCNQNIVL